MAIKINDIPPEGLTVEIDERIDLFETGVAAPVAATMTIRPGAGGSFHISGKASTTAELECSRCLKPFPFTVQDAVMEFELLRESSVQTGAEHELGRGELDTEFYQGDEIEPRDLVREQLLLALPMVPVHQTIVRTKIALIQDVLGRLDLPLQQTLPMRLQINRFPHGISLD